MKNMSKDYIAVKIFLMRHNGHTENNAHRIIKRYGNYLRIEKTGAGFGELKKHLNNICTVIQSDFPAFKEFFNSLPKESYKKKQYNNYREDDYISEALQYTNGCADDF